MQNTELSNVPRRRFGRRIGDALAANTERAHSELMRFLGIDPGLATVGIGLIEAENRFAMHAVDWFTIETKSGGALSDRLKEIAGDLRTFLKEMKPDAVAVERLFFATNAVSALEVAQARGVILLTIAEAGLPPLEPTPLELKMAITGDGQADKRQMQDMVMRLLQLKEIPKPADAADALALGIYAVLHEGRESNVSP